MYCICFFSGTTYKRPPHAVVEEGNVIYNSEVYDNEIFLDVARYKGSTGSIQLAWGVTITPNTPVSFIASPISGHLEFSEGQWNSSIHLRFVFIPVTDQEIEILVKLHNASEGATLGELTDVKITFPAKADNKSVAGLVLKILLPCLALLIIVTTAGIVFLCKGQKM
jgi:hypothetical protein